MMNILPKSLTVAFLAVSIFISGLSADLVRAQSSAPEPMVTLTPEEKAWIAEHPQITIAFVDGHPPYSYKDKQGRFTGSYVDIATEVARRAGLKLKLFPDGNWKSLFAAAQQRQVDVIGGLVMRPERHQWFLFTEPFYSLARSVITRKDETAIRKRENIAGKTVAMVKDFAMSLHILENFPAVKPHYVDDLPAAIDAVANGEADATVQTMGAAAHYISQKGIQNLSFSILFSQGESDSRYGVRKDWPELSSILDKALASIPEKERVGIALRWHPLPVAQAEAARSIKEHLSLTPQEQAWLDKKHTVRVRIVDLPPYQIIKVNEEPQGMVIEYLKLIKERSGINFKYEMTDQPFAEFLESMEEGKGSDMTALIMPTPERERYLFFTEPYLSSPYVIFVREEDNPIFDIQGLFGRTLAVPRGFVVQEQLSRDYPNIRLSLFDSDEKALQAVATGQADAYIGSLTVASHIIHRQGFSAIKVAAPSPFKEQILSMGIRSDWPELTSIINKALASITEEEKTAIRNKYLAIKFEQGINKAEALKWVFIVGGSTLGILIVILFWNRRMSVEISKRKQTELALKRAKDEAETANEAKSTFLASMSHELRTPLNAILGFSRMLAREQNTTSDQQEKLAIINRSGQHLLSMINDVLDLSKIEAEKIELQEHPFDLVALIKEISVMIQSRATEKGLSMAVEAESMSFPYVKTDIGKLRQILVNLMSNAVKFTDAGGVTIKCGSEPMPQEPNRCHIVIEVEDTGPGIEPAQLEKIFEPFVQERNVLERKGTGLGLSICKRYAEFMGGTIEMESEVGRGTIFRVLLPAKIVEAADVRTPVDDKPGVIGLAPAQKNWRVLVADDNRENLLLLKSLLEEVGFLVLEAKNGKAALEVFKSESPDLIWMDMRMPVMDGYEAVRQIRQFAGGDTIPIIAITASAFSEQRQEIIAAGCNDMVTKPFQAHEIFEMMGRFLDIEYIYETKSEAAPDRVREIGLTGTMLAELPAELLQELREATLSLNSEAITAVIERIEPLAPNTAKGLRTLMDDLQMGRLLDLLEELKK